MILSPIDQGIRDQGFNFVPFNQYLATPFQLPTNQINQSTAAPAGLPYIYQKKGGADDNVSTYTGGVNDLISNYNRITKENYFRNQDTPLVDDLRQSKIEKTFMGFPSYREQQLTGPDLGEYIGTGTDVPLELTTAGRIQEGLGSLKDKASAFMGKVANFGPIGRAISAVDKFSSLSPADQQFIEMNMNYTGPTVFGENTTGLGKDPYGINTRSLLGNYADYVEDKAQEYDDLTEEDYANLSAFQRQKVDFYREKQKELQEIKEQKEKERYEEYVRSGRQAEVRDLQNRIDRGDFDSTSNTPDRDRSSVTEESARGSKGVGGGGYTASDSVRDEARGRYMMGGLADLVDIYD